MTPQAHVDMLPRTSSSSHGGLSLDVRCTSYQERRETLPNLLDAVSHCGGWVLDRQALPCGRIEFWFEFPLRAAIELYGSVIASGLEPNRVGHRDIAMLCTLLKNMQPGAARGRLVTLRLEIAFLDQDEDSFPVMAARAPRA